MQLAVVGMGNMGRSFAALALERGHQVTVWNGSPGKCGELVARGAVEARSLEQCAAETDVVLVVLADDAALREVCSGQNGLLASLGPSTVLANVSTVAPATIRELAQAGPDDRVLDAPVRDHRRTWPTASPARWWVARHRPSRPMRRSGTSWGPGTSTAARWARRPP